MRELNNVKVDWSKVLEEEISWKENLFPELKVRERYRELIRMLEQNQIQSRVIYSTDHVSAYCFLLGSSDDQNGLYANIGFASEEEASEPRINSILDWISMVAKRNEKSVSFDRPFNAPEQFDRVCENKGVHKIERVELLMSHDTERDLPAAGESQEVALKLETLELRHSLPFAESEYVSYSAGPEKVFLPASIADLEKLIVRLFDGNSHDKLITEASFVAIEKEKIVGGVIGLITISGPLISDLFVLPEYQGKGISRVLLSASLDVLLSKFAEVRLWSVANSKAYELYASHGFRETGRKEILYFTER